MARVPQQDRPAEASTITYTRREGQAIIAIDRPKALNSLNFLAFQEIQDALRVAERDDSVAVIVITGTGSKAFCAGADLHEHWELCQRPRDYVPWVREFIAMQTAIVRCGKPTIARLNGLVVGAGNELALACDLAIAGDDVVIREVGPLVGSVSGIGVTQWLPLMIGDRRAREVVLLSEDLPAATAHDWGLINKVVPAAELDSAVDAAARRLTDTFPESLRFTRALVNQAKEAAWASSAALAGEWLAIHSGSVETRRGMGSFIEKRPVDHAELRERAARDESPEFPHGPPVGSCPSCGTADLPATFRWCGACGAELAAS
ncbi:enoyl-CoA hydratase-related protein [Saccharopolyspora gloriosae]|uniref:Enoyl-CoA hydratase/carnithine racemase n=1 Tax=Saccharopolyspora gloriosae TaxID=455344 RepID=A0A840NHJ0_9PSEU|nr:enoyl-CoA hydratase/isomerase family protein [Saccharopolyspora gloriosae]MBB5070501.1 enoyl-CoA hydratase/carnithine racemase [Saccharopolyspora gloriosae]